MLDFNRTLFETPMVEEFFTAKGLTAQTGQGRDNFGSVVIKELVDNAIDASEYAGVSPIIGINVKSGLGLHIISVSDNGNGISGDTISRILNFQTRTSDKAAYRTPARGAQGNALKTLIGMPYALGIDEPIFIQSMGTKHSIKAWLDPSGKLRIDHQETDSSVISGTIASVPIPYSISVNPAKWARGFSLFNPHCSFSVKIEEIEWANDHAKSEVIFDEIYQNTADDRWNKFSTKDTPSAFWYDLSAFKRLVYCYISDAQTGGTDILLRDFIMQFRGISSTVKAKAVCSHFTKRRLSEFDGQEEDIGRLLDVLKELSQPPKPSILGVIGEDHFHNRFDELYGVKKFYYKKRLFTDSGVPYVMELAIAKTDPEQGCHTFFGINFSNSFGDPVQAYLQCGDKGMQLYSLAQLHQELGDDDDFSIAFHLTSPVLNFKDRGKTALSLTETMKEELQELTWECSKELYLEKKKRDRNEKAALKADENSLKEATIPIKEAVFKVLIDAMLKATGGLLPTGARGVFYQVRPLIQSYTEKELGYNYFSQTLLTDYRQTVGPLDLLYYDPRGVLYEPHTGIAVPLGTREVDSYMFPSWLYNKILYVEKKGFWPVLKAARLAEKYDMAVVVGEGYGCEAVRVLFSNADKNQNYEIFVLHDADPDGYNICRTLAEETARMPGYKVAIHDMGLSIDYALSIGLPVETFTRKKALPSKLVLSDVALERFTGKRISHSNMFKCERVELNSFTSVQIIDYIESKLIAFGIIEKVIPDANSLPEMADEITKQMVQEMVERIISETLSIPKIANDIHQKYVWDASCIKDNIEEKFNSDRYQSWRGAVKKSFREHLNIYSVSIREDVGLRLKLI
jgi:DNA topoisomerase VI subunit B